MILATVWYQNDNYKITLVLPAVTQKIIWNTARLRKLMKATNEAELRLPKSHTKLELLTLEKNSFKTWTESIMKRLMIEICIEKTLVLA